MTEHSRQIVLLPHEWSRFGRNVDDDESALPRCCGNVSDLRDAILAIAKNNGWLTVPLYADLCTHWDHVRAGHDLDDVKFPVWKLLRKLIEQAGLPWVFP